MITQRTLYFLFIAVFSLGSLHVGMISLAHAEQSAVPELIKGKVIDFIDVPSYTYVEVDTGSEKVWAAAPTTTVKKGDEVSFSTQMPMKDFHSDSIKKDFPLIYFVGNLMKNGDSDKAESTKKTSPHAGIQQVKKSLKGIKKVDGGNDIAEIHAEKDNLKNQTVKVRGQVTRFSAEVMGKNWLHLQDSSGNEDLTVTTDASMAVGDLVVIEGKLELDKDYGYGYIYPVIIQEATVTKE